MSFFSENRVGIPKSVLMEIEHLVEQKKCIIMNTPKK